MSTTDAQTAPAWAGKVVKESGISLGGSLVGTGLNYLVLLVVTRMLTPEGLGLFTLGQSVLAIAMIFVLLGTPRGLERFIPYLTAAGRKASVGHLLRSVFTLTATTAAVVMVVLALAAGWLARDIFEAPGFAPVLRLMLLAIPMLGWVELVSASFVGIKELRYRVYIQQLALPSLKTGLALAALSLGFGVMGWISAYVGSLFFAALLAFVFFRGRLLPEFRSRRTEKADIREVMSFCWPLSVNNFVVVFAVNVGVLLLGVYRSPAEVGVYRIIIYMTLILVLIQTSFAQIYKPLSAGFAATGDRMNSDLLYRRVGKWMLMAGGLAWLIVALLGRDIVGVLFPESYHVGLEALAVLAAGRLAVAACGPQAAALEAFGNTRLSMVNAILMLGVSLGLGYVLIPRMGILGAALSTSIAVLTTAVVGLAEMGALHGLWPFSRQSMRILGAIVLTAAPFWFAVRRLHPLGLGLTALALVLLAGSYLMMLRVLGALDETDRAMFKALRRRALSFGR
ncbi:MAG: oligosaccharide flippase family protein [Candidatus Eisenbacteria bacterium]|nr:oligosaccharide flippase family protein [Candidatus Eisenbacteria bacterium]